jgi:hypothetical protein
MTDQIQVQDDAKLMEGVLLSGDLSKLTPAQRVSYYNRTCESLGLNPLTKPFNYITLRKGLTLYATKDAADQLRRLHGVGIDEVSTDETETHFIVKVKGHDKNNRSDVEVGVVSKKDMQGDFGNAYMKAVTKAKRRLTLSICGLGFLDETEIQSIPDAQPALIDASTGEVVETIPYEDACKVIVKRAGGGEKFLSELNADQLQAVIDNSKNQEQIMAARVVLEHDFNMVQS